MVIFRNNLKIDLLYRLAVEEGEGFGTAYEYFVKIRLLLGLLPGEPVRSILMAGLPEKYGFSLDIFFFANLCRASLIVADTDREKLGRAEELLRILTAKRILSPEGIAFRHVDHLRDINKFGRSDLAVSSLVLHRFPETQRLDHIRFLLNLSRSVIITVPNGGNAAHAKITGLNGISRSEAETWGRMLSAQGLEMKCGLLDMPPFPPGMTVRGLRTKQPGCGVALGARCLEGWAILEGMWPFFIKHRMAHILYCFATRNSGK